MLRSVSSARKKPYIGIKKTKLIEYTDNVQSVNEFIKERKEDKLKNDNLR